MSDIVKEILRTVSSALQIPTMVILILLILLTIIMLGSFAAEFFTERRALRINIPKLVDQLQGKNSNEMKDVIGKSTLLARQKAAAQELIGRLSYPEDTREALARQLIADEEMRYQKVVRITDLAARVAPMFGLMGTLIPLGPGLMALGAGNAAELSDSLLIAFDTTVAGLISGAVSYVISGVRKGWYEQYMIGLETIMETILDVQSTEKKKLHDQSAQESKDRKAVKESIQAKIAQNKSGAAPASDASRKQGAKAGAAAGTARQNAAHPAQAAPSRRASRDTITTPVRPEEQTLEDLQEQIRRAEAQQAAASRNAAGRAPQQAPAAPRQPQQAAARNTAARNAAAANPARQAQAAQRQGQAVRTAPPAGAAPQQPGTVSRDTIAQSSGYAERLLAEEARARHTAPVQDLTADTLRGAYDGLPAEAVAEYRDSFHAARSGEGMQR